MSSREIRDGFRGVGRDVPDATRDIRFAGSERRCPARGDWSDNGAVPFRGDSKSRAVIGVRLALRRSNLAEDRRLRARYDRRRRYASFEGTRSALRSSTWLHERESRGETDGIE